MTPVDLAEASSEFIAASDLIESHDRGLWDLRKKRDRAVAAVPEWEELRELASAIKEHTLSHLAEYLEQFEAAAQANGVTVHWARDAAEHNQVVHDLPAAHGAKSVVKSHSMLPDECDMRPFLEARGIAVIETDLGERIQQSTTSRRVTSSCPRCTSCAATWPRSSSTEVRRASCGKSLTRQTSVPSCFPG